LLASSTITQSQNAAEVLLQFAGWNVEEDMCPW